MKMACELSVSAFKNGNEPFGALLVKDGIIVCESENKVNVSGNPLEHAEIKLLRDFINETGIAELKNFTLYSSCEPCFMCSGAIVRAKVGKVVYGASHSDLERILGKKRCNCSKTVFKHSSFAPIVVKNVMRKDCVSVLKEYFENNKK